MKDILLIIFGLLIFAGLVVLRFRFTKDRNPNADLLIDALRCISGSEHNDISKKECQNDRNEELDATGPVQ